MSNNELTVTPPIFTEAIPVGAQINTPEDFPNVLFNLVQDLILSIIFFVAKVFPTTAPPVINKGGGKGLSI